MERIERTSVPAVPFLTVLGDQCARMIRSLLNAGAPPAFGHDVAFSDNLERELIQRELHTR